jgi:hypothetical protein
MRGQWRWQGWTKRARRGQAITEMALMTPFFLLILLGAIDLGRVYIVQNRLNAAVKEAAMLGLYQPDPATVQERAFQEVREPGTNPRHLLGVEGTDFWVVVECYKPGPPAVQKANCDTPAPGEYIEVTGFHNFQPITSQILRFLPANGTIKKTVRAVY